MKTAEEWRYIKNYESFYQVSNMGNVRSVGRMTILKNGINRFCIGQILTPSLNRGKYHIVSLSKDAVSITKTIHQLVAQTFINNPSGYKQLNHINGIKTDNRAVNLEWCSDKHNKQHAKLHGLKNDVGEYNPNSKINENQVRVILKCGDIKNSELAKIFGVSPSMIGRIKKRTSWKHLQRLD